MIKRLLQNLALLALSLIVAMAGIELLLRVLPNTYANAFEFYVHNRSVKPMSGWGDGFYTLTPDTVGREHGPCYDIAPIPVNGAGFRDRSWPVEKSGQRLMVLGDSFVEARQVRDEELASRQLEGLLGREVFNAGVSGYGTITELEAYRRLLRPYRPDVVVLFFYLGNDMKDNSCDLDLQRQLCGRIEEGEVRFVRRPVDRSPQSLPQVDMTEKSRVGQRMAMERQEISALAKWLRRHLVSYLALHDLKVMLRGVTNQTRGKVLDRWQQYLIDEPPVWHDAWTITEEALATLKREVAEDGGRLVVVAIPEHFATSADWRKELMMGTGTGIATGLDSAYPSRRLVAMARALDLPVLDLLPVLSAYRDRHALGYPFFSLACDGHWNPLTHYLAAREVAVFLAANGLLAPPFDAAKLAAARDEAFARPPETILGAEAYGQLYRRGFYTGGAATGRADGR